MDESFDRAEISYPEYRVIADLLRAHVDEHGGRLKAMLAFGDLVTRGNTYDIDLLEIVQGWEGPRFGQFASTAELPLRGQLRLYILTPEVLRDPGLIADPDEREWVEELLDRVRGGYELILENSPGWVQSLLAQSQRANPTYTAPPSGAMMSSDPLTLLRKAS